MIQLEEKYSGQIWKNIYTSDYIEGITQKTGNAKKFPVFVKMLMGAINQASETVFIEILTAHDLQMLKQRKNYKNNSTKSGSLSSNNTMSNNSNMFMMQNN